MKIHKKVEIFQENNKILLILYGNFNRSFLSASW